MADPPTPPRYGRRPPTVGPACPAAWLAGMCSGRRLLAPLPVTDLWHVLTMPGDGVPVCHELVAHRLHDVGRPTPQSRHAAAGLTARQAPGHLDQDPPGAR